MDKINNSECISENEFLTMVRREMERLEELFQKLRNVGGGFRIL